MLDRDLQDTPGTSASLKDFALARIRDAIRTGELEPGEAISETLLATRFGLGKAAVRIALARLSANALVTRGTGRSWRVAELTPLSVAECLSLRRLLEPQLAEAHLTAAALGELEALAGPGAVVASAATSAPALDALRGYDRRFMARLVALHPGATLGRWLAELWDVSAQANAFLARTSDTPPPVHDRTPLVAALRRGDRAEAATLLDDAVAHAQRWTNASLLRLPQPLHVPVRAPAGTPSPGLSRGRQRPSASSTPATDSRPHTGEDR